MLADLQRDRPGGRAHGSEVEERRRGRVSHWSFRFYFAIMSPRPSSVKHAKKCSRIVCGMKLTTIAICGALVLGLASDARGQTLDPKALAAALAAKPAGRRRRNNWPRSIRTWFGGSENLVKGPAPKIDDLDGGVGDRGAGPRGQRSRAARRVGCGRLHHAARESRRHRVVRRRRDARRTATRCRGTTSWPTGGWAARSSRSTRHTADSREQPGRAQGHAEADAGVGEPDLRRHDARLVGLRAGAVQRRVTRRGDGLPGRRRRTRTTCRPCSTT